MTYTVSIEEISTGRVAPSLLVRMSNKDDARAYAEAAIAAQPNAADLRVHSIKARRS